MANIVSEAFGKRLYINEGYYLDSKTQPVQTFDDLNLIPRQQRFIGLEVLVIDEDKKYRLKNGTKNSDWVAVEEGNSEMFWEGDDSIENDINN